MNKVQHCTTPSPKSQKSSTGSTECYRCGLPECLADKCWHKETACHYCKKVGHLEQACQLKQCNRACNHIKSDDTTESDESEPIVPLFYVHDTANRSAREPYSPYMCEAVINSQTVRIEIDTGSVVPILNESFTFPIVACNERVSSLSLLLHCNVLKYTMSSALC